MTNQIYKFIWKYRDFLYVWAAYHFAVCAGVSFVMAEFSFWPLAWDITGRGIYLIFFIMVEVFYWLGADEAFPRWITKTGEE